MAGLGLRRRQQSGLQRQRDGERPGERRPAPLENVHRHRRFLKPAMPVDGVGIGRQHRLACDAQRRRRRLAARVRRPHEESERARILRHDLQPTHRIRTRFRKPHQHRAHALLLQNLLGSPGRFVFARAHPDHAFECDAPRLQRARIGLPGRRDQHDVLTVARREGLQRRRDEPHFADAAVLHQQLGQAAGRPAFAGQQRIESGVPARHDARGCPGKLVPLPHPAAQPGGQGARGMECCSHDSCDALSKGDTPPSRHKPGKAELSPAAGTGYRKPRQHLYIYTVSKKEGKEVLTGKGKPRCRHKQGTHRDPRRACSSP